MSSNRLIELRNRAYDAQDRLAEFLTGPDANPEEANRRESDVNALFAELKSLEAMDAMAERHVAAIDERRQVKGHLHAGGGGHGAPQGTQHASVGEAVKVELLKTPGRKSMEEKEFAVDVMPWLRPELKANFLTTSWTPEVRRTPRIVDKIAQQITILDLFGVEPMEFAGITYAEETTSTNAATEIGENVTYPESALAMTIRTVMARKIGTSLPVSDELLSDVPQTAAFIDLRLSTFVRKRLETQILVGDGVAPNILGILNHPSTQSQAKGADDVLTAIFKGITKVRVTGQTDPNFILLHPNDVQDIRTLKTTQGSFIWGDPSVAGPVTVFGLPLVQSTIITENTALLGDSLQALLYMRQGVEVLVGYVASQFVQGMQTCRCSLRTNLAIFRGEGFCTVTGI